MKTTAAYSQEGVNDGRSLTTKRLTNDTWSRKKRSTTEAVEKREKGQEKRGEEHPCPIGFI
jgi:hypothetical protein